MSGGQSFYGRVVPSLGYRTRGTTDRNCHGTVWLHDKLSGDVRLRKTLKERDDALKFTVFPQPPPPAP